ncbi:TetR/AcrR family transcriptional regulator [Streptomyces sp. NPDC058417]|uniref:TetR/AcrR family transcriptional regulator n=1 Tax=unclassified Streptomyces TaxID=2593676 RepID=UPI0036554FA4
MIDLSGLTKGALYFHFPDKEALATAVLARLDVAPDPPDDPVRLQALITLTHRYWKALDSDPVLRGAAVLAGHPDLVPPRAHRAPLAVVTRLLEEAAWAGELLRGIHPADTAQLIVAMLLGLRRSPLTAGRREQVTVMWRHLLPGLAVPGLIPALRITPHGEEAREPIEAGSGMQAPGPAPCL